MIRNSGILQKILILAIGIVAAILLFLGGFYLGQNYSANSSFLSDKTRVVERQFTETYLGKGNKYTPHKQFEKPEYQYPKYFPFTPERKSNLQVKNGDGRKMAFLPYDENIKEDINCYDCIITGNNGISKILKKCPMRSYL